jgi:hypothetical protein
VNHAVIDGTSLWNFFNTFTEKSRGVKRISKQLDFTRSSSLISSLGNFDDASMTMGSSPRFRVGPTLGGQERKSQKI